MMNPARSILLFAVALLAGALWLSWLWQPERQVRLHTQTLLQAIERRQWSKVEALVADSYADRWGHDKGIVLAGLQQVFGGFIFLTIEHRDAGSQLLAGRSVEQVKISGQGGAVAQFVITRVNELGEPFTFTWRKREGGPWAWELVEVAHPRLETGRMPGE